MNNILANLRVLKQVKSSIKLFFHYTFQATEIMSLYERGFVEFLTYPFNVY